MSSVGKESWRNYRRFLWLMAAMLLIACLRVIDDPDIWFHLSFGREIVTNGIPDQEFLVFTRFGEPADYNSWGFGVLYFEAWSMLGLYGMAWINAAIGTATLLLLVLAAQRHQQPPRLLPLCLVVTVAYIGMEFRLVYRPETLLYLAIAAEILLLERYLDGANYRWLLPIPVLTALIAMSHPSAIILIGIAGLYSLQALWDRRLKWPDFRRSLVSLSTLIIAALALSGLTPIGYEQLLLPIYFALNSPVTQDIVEFLPAMETEYGTHFLVLAIVIPAAIFYSRPRRIIDLLLYLVFAYLAFKHVRNIPLLALVGFVPLARAAQQLWLATPARSKGVDALGIVFCGIVLMLIPLRQQLWGMGTRSSCCTEASATFLREHRPQGNLLNFYDLGNYLGWALKGEYSVFIDGRNNVASQGLRMHDFLFRADPGWRRLAARHNIRTIVTRATLPYSGTLIPLVEELSGDPQWTLVVAEPAGLTFIRNNELPQPSLSSLPKPQMIWNQVLEETEMTIAQNPDAAEIYHSRAKAFLHLGQSQAANKSFQQYKDLGGVNNGFR